LVLVGVIALVASARPIGHVEAHELVTPPDDPARELALLTRALDRTARVLYVTAHPDDEDSALLTRLVRGEGVEVLLQSLTRGDGGQNEIGTELFHAIGSLRSRELQSAARYTGVTQLFARPFEFGYSFSVEETFEKWGREAVLRDVVRVVRGFRPDVILTMIDEGEGGGQHHQASAILAAEAYQVAADERWPELGEPHATARLYRQVWSDEPDWSRGLDAPCEMDVGEFDPVLGATYVAVGNTARAQHKCQGMARGYDPFPGRTSRWEWRLARNEEPHPVSHVLDGLAEPLVEGEDGGVTAFGRSLREHADAVRRACSVEEPEAAVPALAALWRFLASSSFEGDPTAMRRLGTLRARTARALALAAGVHLTVRGEGRYVAAGDTDARATATVLNAGPHPVDVTLSVRPQALRWPGEETDPGHDVGAGSTVEFGAIAPGDRASMAVSLPPAPATIPWPMPAFGGDVPPEREVDVLDPDWVGFEAWATIAVAGVSVALPPVPVVAQEVDATLPTVREAEVHAVPDPSVRPAEPTVARPVYAGAPDTVPVTFLVSSLAGGPVTVTITPPAGWLAEPAQQDVETRGGGEEVPVTAHLSRLTGEAAPREGIRGSAIASVAYAGGPGPASTAGYRRIEYPHIRPATITEDAEVEVVEFPCTPPTEVRVGFVVGTGDRMVEALIALGIEADLLGPRDLLEGDLGAYDTIVTGVRAYQVRDDLAAATDRLRTWMEAGGTLVVQYNKYELNGGEEISPFTPYPARVGNRRVTVEGSPVTLVSPDHPLFTRPNRITAVDFDRWVQERGLYFLEPADDRYVDLLILEDPWPYNAGEKGGALVVASVGEGAWVYLGIGLFRQLPAAVPGAYRILSNLLQLGGDPSP
jgi:LmbE family N-acetylglucosaminyl deacetylase